MPKISTLGQKLWPTGRETHTHTHTHTQTEKANTEDLFFRIFFYFRFSFKGAVRFDIRNFKSLCHLFRSTDSFKINKGYIAKKLQKKLKIAISRSNLKISKNKKKTPRMVHLRILHAKNQPPRPKTVAYRPRTHRHTDRQTEKANTEDPFFRKKFFLIFNFSFKGAVQLISF